MSFLEFLRENDALCNENLVQPHLGAWATKYLMAYPLEEQERDFLKEIANERWYDADDVLEELEAKCTD